jgi:hypothetical protein
MENVNNFSLKSCIFPFLSAARRASDSGMTVIGGGGARGGRPRLIQNFREGAKIVDTVFDAQFFSKKNKYIYFLIFNILKLFLSSLFKIIFHNLHFLLICAEHQLQLPI